MASDTIDLTNLAFAGSTVTAVASGANTKVTVVSGATKSTFTVAGSWASSGFTWRPTVLAGTIPDAYLRGNLC